MERALERMKSGRRYQWSWAPARLWCWVQAETAAGTRPEWKTACQSRAAARPQGKTTWAARPRMRWTYPPNMGAPPRNQPLFRTFLPLRVILPWTQWPSFTLPHPSWRLLPRPRWRKRRAQRTRSSSQNCSTTSLPP